MGEVTNSGRTLVLCFDGTASQYEAENTNIPQLFALLKKDDFNQQLCYYQAGIGTWFNPGVVSPMFAWGAKVLDYAFAWYLDQHVIDGYKFIMNNWRTGDKICLFGFSRGAYTARALAGALYKVGLLPKGNDNQVPFAYKLYKRQDKEGIELAAGFKNTYCQEVKIEFIGVWDTVSSVGLVMGRSLPFVSSNNSIKTFRHALSLDEHRARFRPNLYHKDEGPTTAPAAGIQESNAEPVSPIKESDDEPASPIKGTDSDSSDSGIGSSSNENGSPERKGKRHFLPFRFRSSSGRIRIRNVGEEQAPDDVLEVWFAGCHSDVGGGEVPNSTTQALEDITLRWMLREIVKSQCGILFENDALKRAGVSLSLDDAECKTQDDQDALMPIHDALKSNVLWWILEILPMTCTWQDASGKWKSSFGWHLGRGRDLNVINPRPVFHSSVKTRMASNLKYKPRAQYTPGSESYVS